MDATKFDPHTSKSFILSLLAWPWQKMVHLLEKNKNPTVFGIERVGIERVK